jgi:hypothetical protein
VLSHLPVDQEPGHRRRIAVEPTGDWVLSQWTAGSPAPSDRGAVPPPSALANVWARSDAVAPTHLRRLPAHGPQLGRKRARASALAPGWAEIPPAQLAGISFFFFFSHLFSPFSYIYLYADILCTKNSPNKL